MTWPSTVETIAEVPDKGTREKPAAAFGTWLKYMRQLTKISQEDAARKARVSFDAVKRMERGELTGATYLVAWISWLSEQRQIRDGGEFEIWPQKLLDLGREIRAIGDAIRQTSVSPSNVGGRAHTKSAPKQGGHPLAVPSVTHVHTDPVSDASSPTVRRAAADLLKLSGESEPSRAMGKSSRPARVVGEHAAAPRPPKAGHGASAGKRRR